MRPVALLVCLLIAAPLLADSPPQIRINSSLPLTTGERAALLGGTKASQLNSMRAAVQSSRYGNRGLQNIFKNFEGDHYLDPMLPGVRKNVQFLSSPSWQQAKGAMRTLVYATPIHNDARFELLELDKPAANALGRTDKDLFFRHKATGQLCRVEVKDVSPSSQRTDLTRIKRQIDLMAEEQRRTGELQAWVNRQKVIPEVEAYARSKGVPVYSETRQRRFGAVLDDFDARAQWRSNVRLAGGVAEMGLGVLLVYEKALDAFHDLEGLLNAQQRTSRDWMQFGSDATYTGMGLTFTASGAVSLTSRLVRTSPLLESVEVFSEWAGPIGLGLYVVAAGLDEGVAIYDYQHGTIDRQQFVIETTGVGVGVGAVAIGAIIGTIIEPGGGTLAGAAIGGLVGGPASFGTTYLMDKHYADMNAEQRERLHSAIINKYGVQ